MLKISCERRIKLLKTVNDLKKMLRKDINGNKKSSFQSLASDVYEYYNGITVWFECINYRFPEIMNLYINLPIELLKIDIMQMNEISVFAEDYILRELSPVINEFGKSLCNESKEIRAQGDIKMQPVDNKIVRRTGVLYHKGSFVLKMWCRFPLMGVSTVSGKNSCRLITELLKILDAWIEKFDASRLYQKAQVYKNQCEIRNYLKENGYVCFIKNGSILPREKENHMPKMAAIPFKSPSTMEHTIHLTSGEAVTGMMIPKGLTVITGGGYSGKTTMMDAIESGIYPHIEGDGREYVITEETALKVYAEDGRTIHNLDMSPFFKQGISGERIDDFSTEHASGSVSQAANIIEAIYAGSELLLIDEDKSATNFMIRDNMMRKIIKNEPIIPLTDRMDELTKKRNLAVIMVIGAISEYFHYADRLLLIEDYKLYDISNEIKKAEKTEKKLVEENICNWTTQRKIKNTIGSMEKCFFRTVHTENNRKIILDNYTADVMSLTTITTNEQLNSLAFVMEKLLEKMDKDEMKQDVRFAIEKIFSVDSKNNQEVAMMMTRKDRWYEEIRNIDAICCMNRMRGVKFCSNFDD